MIGALTPDTPRRAPEYEAPDKDTKREAALEAFTQHCADHHPCYKAWRPALDGDPEGLCPRANRLLGRLKACIGTEHDE